MFLLLLALTTAAVQNKCEQEYDADSNNISYYDDDISCCCSKSLFNSCQHIFTSFYC